MNQPELKSPIKYLLECAELFYKYRRVGKAIDLYVQVLEGEPENTDAALRLGVCLLSIGEVQRAHGFLNKLSSSDLDPNSKLWTALCELYLGNQAKASAYIENPEQFDQLLEDQEPSLIGLFPDMSSYRDHFVSSNSR